MKKKLQLIKTGDMSREDWLHYRKKGLGASDIGTVLGINPYKCSAQLFYEKLGDEIPTVENMAMFMGKAQEDFLADLWQYWNPSDPGEGLMMQNYNEGRIIRRCQRVNAYVTNPDFPWLFVSLDRKINKYQDPSNVYSIEGEGALELKTIAGYEADKWEAGIPPAYVVQVQTQLLVCEFTFGELAVLKDGREYQVYPFEKNEDVCNTIIEETRKFWERVEKGRAAMTRKFEAERNFNYKAAQEAEAELTDLEPPPDGSEAFAKYLKERYKIAEPGEQKGTDEQMEIAQRQKAFSLQIKELEESKRECENRLKNVLRDGASKLDFGPYGYVSWKSDVNGTRRFINKVKSE